MLRTIMQKESGDSRFLEFTTLHDTSFTRMQIEQRNGTVFMRAKRRAYVRT